MLRATAVYLLFARIVGIYHDVVLLQSSLVPEQGPTLESWARLLNEDRHVHPMPNLLRYLYPEGLMGGTEGC